MHLHRQVLDCVAFLCVEDWRPGGIGRYICGGTVFFVAVGTEAGGHLYAVTARHCVDRARARGSLFLRLNAVDGGVRHVQINSGWVFHPDPNVDAAVLPIPTLPGVRPAAIPEETFALRSSLDEYEIGIGDDVVVCGLFTQRAGTQRNIPIVRAGIIAAMPDEPVFDAITGQSFDAYLVEARSLGGLSGSPVFTYTGYDRGPEGKVNKVGRNFLLGLIRGHWDQKNPASMPDFASDDTGVVNMGIALVTPVQFVREILNSDELVMQRQRDDQARAMQFAPTMDSALNASPSKPPREHADVNTTAFRVMQEATGERPKERPPVRKAASEKADADVPPEPR